jgi:glycerol-3-phosphate dehydrogenase
METQVVIIGGGIMGTMLARELSQYNVDVILLEKNADVATGVSTKGGGGMIYSPLDFSWGSSTILKSIAKETKSTESTSEAEKKKEQIIIEGRKVWNNLWDELDIDYIKFPRFMILAMSEDDLPGLKVMEEIAQARSYNYTKLSKQDILSLEPHVSKDVVAGLADDKADYRQVHPWEPAIALAEVARQNGVKIMCNAEVTGFSKGNGFQIVETAKGPIKTEFIINAAGAYGAHVASMADVCDFSLQYFRGHTIIADKNVGEMVKSWITTVPRPGIMKGVQPTPSGNLYVGLTYKQVQDPSNTAVDRAELEEAFARGKSILPALSRKDVITYYVGMRVFSARDPEEYIVEYAPKNPRFISTIPRLPGNAPAPAMAKMVTGMLADSGLQLTRKDDFNPYRKGIPRFSKLSSEERKELIAKDPRYGHVVCRCETITEGEIVEAIKRGATTVDGVKFRTRAGMGRCQGGFCGPRVVDILARELNISPTQVTKRGGDSRLLLYQSKELLEARKEYAHG